MRFLFVDLLPRSRLFRSPLWMPTFLTPSASLLRSLGHDVLIVERGEIDAGEGNNGAQRSAAFGSRVARFGPDVVLFDGRAMVLSDLRDLAETAGRAASNALVLAGGRYPTLMPRDALEAVGGLDGAISGEIEEPLRALAGGGALETIPAAAFRKGGTVVVNTPSEPIMDLDSLPFPAWDLLDMGYHTRRTPRVIPCFHLSTATLAASRGCGNNCTFCSEGRLYARPVRYHSGTYVAAMMERLVRDYGVEGIYFSDEMLLADRERAGEIFEELIRKGLSQKIRWSAQVRTDAVDRETLRLMKKAGCVQLEFGIESGSQRVLDSMAKGTTVAGNRAALAMARAEGIRSLAYAIYGFPGESRDDLGKTADFLKKTRPDIVRLLRYIPLPGTALTKKLVAEGRLRPFFWRDQVRRGDPFGGETVNLSAMSDRSLEKGASRIYFTASFPSYLEDFVRQGCVRHFNEIFHPAGALSILRRRLPRFLPS